MMLGEKGKEYWQATFPERLTGSTAYHMKDGGCDQKMVDGKAVVYGPKDNLLRFVQGEGKWCGPKDIMPMPDPFVEAGVLDEAEKWLEGKAKEMTGWLFGFNIGGQRYPVSVGSHRVGHIDDTAIITFGDASQVEGVYPLLKEAFPEFVFSFPDPYFWQKRYLQAKIRFKRMMKEPEFKAALSGKNPNGETEE